MREPTHHISLKRFAIHMAGVGAITFLAVANVLPIPGIVQVLANALLSIVSVCFVFIALLAVGSVVFARDAIEDRVRSNLQKKVDPIINVFGMVILMTANIIPVVGAYLAGNFGHALLMGSGLLLAYIVALIVRGIYLRICGRA